MNCDLVNSYDSQWSSQHYLKWCVYTCVYVGMMCTVWPNNLQRRTARSKSTELAGRWSATCLIKYWATNIKWIPPVYLCLLHRMCHINYKNYLYIWRFLILTSADINSGIRWAWTKSSKTLRTVVSSISKVLRSGWLIKHKSHCSWLARHVCRGGAVGS